jgi:hypothetical protein
MPGLTPSLIPHSPSPAEKGWYCKQKQTFYLPYLPLPKPSPKERELEAGGLIIYGFFKKCSTLRFNLLHFPL